MNAYSRRMLDRGYAWLAVLPISIALLAMISLLPRGEEYIDLLVFTMILPLAGLAALCASVIGIWHAVRLRHELPLLLLAMGPIWFAIHKLVSGNQSALTGGDLVYAALALLLEARWFLLTRRAHP